MCLCVYVSRYVAVCHPLHARRFINMRGTRVAICVVFSSSLVYNLPRFWHYRVETHHCSALFPELSLVPSGGAPCPCFYSLRAPRESFQRLQTPYNVSWAVCAVCVPLVLLVFCNAGLICALRHSRRLQARCRANKPQGGAGGGATSQHITPTLIVLVVLFIAMVSPAELLGLFSAQLHALMGSDAFLALSEVANGLLLLNFTTINLVLYCTMNVQFRRVLVSQLCRGAPLRRLQRGLSSRLQMSRMSSLHTATCRVSDAEPEPIDDRNAGVTKCVIEIEAASGA